MHRCAIAPLRQRWQSKSKRTLFVYSRYPENLGALPYSGQASLRQMLRGRKASMEGGPHEACQELGIPSMRRGSILSEMLPSAPVSPQTADPLEFRMMEAGATIRILCFARHCFRATSPPYPSTEVDFRKAQDRLAKPVQAGNPSSAGFLPIRRFRLSGWLHPFASPTATRALPP